MRRGELGYPSAMSKQAMSRVERRVAATPEQVWAVLADGWLYPLWVVGAARMRDVDDDWPAKGSRLHHSVGSWPALLDDTTTMLEATPPTYARLKARAWPSGEAEVRLHLQSQGAQTLVVIEEDAVSGPGTLVPGPARRALITWRNVEALRRLAALAERRVASTR